MNAGVWDIAFTHCGKFFTKVGAMLILGNFSAEKNRVLGMYLDVSDDWIPTRSYENVGRQ